ncbi:RICIN domain-containing protein [Leucobacter luti]|uniref:RICIN domain-containing protein n=1 Tax=Leucobacter luti TaxID=340320 RepID=UPI001C68B473|nr:RICIN domain-containing protein [Leucobacter luti]QYM76318.1 RICIN domain-containing protein [Leucobacter luti]
MSDAALQDAAWLNTSFAPDQFDIQVARIVDGLFLQDGSRWSQAEAAAGETAERQCLQPLRPGGPACEFDVKYINASGRYLASFQFALRAQPGSTPSPALLDALRFNLSSPDGAYAVSNQTWEQMQTMRSYQGNRTIAPMEQFPMTVKMWIPQSEKSPVQDWTLLADKTLRLGNGNCLDDVTQNAVNGSQVLSYECHGFANQQWTYNATTKAIQNVASGKCLAWGPGGFAAGVTVVSWACNGALSQQFDLPGMRTKNATGDVLVAQGGNSNSGVTLQPIAAYAGVGPTQDWQHWGDGTVRLGNGMCVDDPTKVGENGIKLLSYDCHGGDNQRWIYTAATGALKNVATGKCMAWEDGLHAVGKALVSWGCNASLSQNYRMPGLLAVNNAGAVLSVQGGPSNSVLTLQKPNGATGYGLHGTQLVVQLHARASGSIE